MKGLRLRPGPEGGTGVVARGGLNPKMNNALREGGPRNGVMTALEDFTAEHDRALRVKVVPMYFSLAIVAEEDRIAAQPKLGEALDRLDNVDVLRELLELCERLRLKEVVWAHQAFFGRQDRLERVGQGYMDLLKASLSEPPEEMMVLEACLKTIRDEKVTGDLVQCGAVTDDGPVFMRGFLLAYQVDGPRIWVFGPAAPDGRSLEGASERLRRFDLLDERVNLLAGSETRLAQAPIDRLALLRVGWDIDLRAALDQLSGKLAIGGFVLVDTAGDPRRLREAERLIPAGVALDGEVPDAGTVCWRKVADLGDG
jgi:hypothetical protein